MAATATSTLPPNLRRLNLSVPDLHLATGLPIDVLELYAAGRFRPTGADLKALQHFANLLYDMTPMMMALYLDKVRFRLLRNIIPRADVDRLLALQGYAEYRRALHDLSEMYADELEAAITAAARKAGYDPAGRE